MDISSATIAQMLWPSYANYSLEVANIPRRRVNAKAVPITISLKPSMVADIEEQLTYKESRSEWIADAITAQLDDGKWSVVRDGNALQMFHAFKRKMTDEEVSIDLAFLELLENTIKAQSESALAKRFSKSN